ncbi:MAG: von Willebrand factor type A domain-containing protein [Acidimicrobiaceae bacterium]|nr:von Willebrand factor type A domain-containing protein [Acidimicrobiaceae bacterium]
MLHFRTPDRPRRTRGFAWRIAAVLLAFCLAAVACTSADTDADGTAATPDGDAITQTTAAASSGRDRPDTTRYSEDMADDDMAEDEESGALGGAAAEEDIEAAIAGGSAEEEMSDESGGQYSGGGLSQAGSAQSAPEPDHEPYEPPRRRHIDPDNFVDYGVNPFVDTADDPFSTFALDVDTASYTVARNFLDGGQLPPFEAVRVEEFVNYFDGGYPDEIDEFTINVDAAPSPFADDGDLLLRVGVQAPHVVSDAVEPDSIILVLDSSGSMNQETGTGNYRTRRIQLVYDAVDLLLEGLEPETRVGVVAYDDHARTVARPSAASRNHDDLMRRIQRDVRPGGSTNVADGLVTGFRMAESEASRGRHVLVLLFSDGVANVGATETDRILRQLGERSDIGLSTIGVGLGPFNDELMEQLANRADGSYHYIDNHDEARRLLGGDITSFVSVAARDAKVQVIFNPDTVAAYRLLGFENRDVADRDFRNDAVDAGEVAIGQSATALYELALVELDSRSRRSSETLAKVTLRYQRPASERITETSATIRPRDTHRSFDDADRHFRLAAVAAEFAEVLRDSWFVDDWSMRILSREADAVARDFRGSDDVAELARLIDAARRLQ